jgi:hypothetical protein
MLTYYAIIVTYQSVVPLDHGDVSGTQETDDGMPQLG